MFMDNDNIKGREQREGLVMATDGNDNGNDHGATTDGGPHLPPALLSLSSQLSVSVEAFAWRMYMTAVTAGAVSNQQVDSEDPAAEEGESNDESAVSSRDIGGGTATADITLDVKTGGPVLLSAPHRLRIQFRVQKKMLLWDSVLAAAWASV